jgi:NAD(P)-dependent dehydrogenase (short-subunit alcohol dehydrogenase family)
MTALKGTIVLTGANGGLGNAVVSQIATSPQLGASYHGVYAVRNTVSAHSLDVALASHAHSHEKVALDLADLNSVRKVAAGINERVAAGTIPRIHALVVNAGFEEFTTDTHTEDGFDMAFAANYLGHWLLTMLLLQSMDPEVGRVLWTSSWVHK